MDYNNECYIDKQKKRTKFIPQEIIKIEKNIDNTLYFPDINHVDFTKLKISNIGLFSVAVPNLADNIIKDIKKFLNQDLKQLTITDAMANCGGMSIQFCNHFKFVNCCEIIKEQCKILKNNLQVYGFSNFNIYCGDYMDSNLREDIIFFDPPWGKDFWNAIQLEMNNINILCIINNILTTKDTRVCILLIPPAFDITNIEKYIDPNIKYQISKIHFINKQNKQKTKDIIYFYKMNKISNKRLISKYKLLNF
jgi:16S rRNA G966 N2-methylase RsmD